MNDLDQTCVRIKAPATQAAVGAPTAGIMLKAEEEQVAVLICHGMGQQVPFATLDCVAKALLDAAPRPSPEVQVQFIKFGDDWLPRAALTLRDAAGTRRTVHLYEAYWAPLTEGRVTALDVVKFLLAAGWNGVKYSLRGAFDRWMFGGPQSLPLPAITLLQLLLACIVLGSMLMIFFAFVAVAALHVLMGFNILWPDNVLTATLTRDLLYSPLILSIPIAVYGALAVLYGVVRRLAARRAGSPRAPTAPRVKQPPARWMRLAAGLLLDVILIATVFAGASILYHLAVHWGDSSIIQASTPLDARPAAQPWRAFFYTLFFAASAALIYKARWFFVQYAGDVAAYVSAHTVSKFHEVRERIRATGIKVAHAVYEARAANSPDFAYQRIIVVGHSLGSVVAYDTLNAVINNDILSGGALRAVQRTHMLLTLGSPLDKTAFIFRTQTKNAVVREALAAAKQPLIQDYTLRPARWVNIWSRHDWISGPLEYYDEPLQSGATADTRRVENIEDREAYIPLAAHTQYWDHTLFAETLYRAIVQPVSGGR